MALNFPSTPNVGQLYPLTPSPGIPTYTWDGEKWIVAGTGSDTAYVHRAGDTMSGGLTLNYDSPVVVFNKTSSGQGAGINSQTNGITRWNIQLGSSEAETGSNVGSNFTIDRHGDDGAGIANAVKIDRSTGAFTVAADAYAANFLATSAVYAAHLQSSGGAVVAGTVNAGSVISGTDVSATNALLASNYIRATNGIYCGYGGLSLDNTVDAGGYYIGYMVSCNPNIYWMRVNGLHVPGSWAGIRLESGGYMLDFRGDYAYTTVGGPFIAYSDERIKNVLGDYTNGLDAVTALQPVRFTFKGNETDLHPSNPMKMGEDGKPLPLRKDVGVAPYDTSMHYNAAVEQKEFIGLIAQQAEVPMPETVKAGKGFIDGVEVQDLRTLDTGPIIFALINAVKELKARVEELEAQ